MKVALADSVRAAVRAAIEKMYFSDFMVGRFKYGLAAWVRPLSFSGL